MIRKVLGYSLFLVGISVIILWGTLGITGNAISDNPGSMQLIDILGLSVILVSIMLMVSRKSLDVIILPTGKEDVERARKGGESLDKLKDEGYYLISGVKDTPGLRDSHRYRMYNALRQYGIPPKQIYVEGKSTDTAENLIYSLKQIKTLGKKKHFKSPIDVGIVSYPSHLRRFMDFYREAVKEGMFDASEFRVHKIRTKESVRDKVYETSPMRRVMHYYKLRNMSQHATKGKKSNSVMKILRKIPR